MAATAWLVGLLQFAVLAAVTLANNTTVTPSGTGDVNSTTAAPPGDFQCYVCDGEVAGAAAGCGRTVNSSVPTTGCAGHCMTRRTGALGAHVWKRSCENECEESCLQAPPAEACTYCCQEDLCNGDLNTASTQRAGVWIGLLFAAHAIVLWCL